jgi:D-beta-D-heptose 7-phosphate kinase/D-beta-D-heptose 1-phosphate adenosyltransferase
MKIWVNGCFDIIHSGHIDLLWYAKLYSNKSLTNINSIKTNKLFVGIDSDERIKKLKGDKRPINVEFDRYRILNNLKMVDSVVIFNTDDELRHYIKMFDIDYIIIGDQYKDKTVIGLECSKHGVVYYPVDEHSTTSIVEKIRNL